MLLRRVAISCALIAACGGCGGCGAGGVDDGGVDSGLLGPDLASPHDQGADVPDASDSGDAAAFDATDVGAGWEPLPGTPPSCALQRATRPGLAFTPSWGACPAGAAAGCTMLNQPTAVANTPLGAYSHAKGHFVMLWRDPGGVSPPTQEAFFTTDETELVLSGPFLPECAPGLYAQGGGRTVFTSWITDATAGHYTEREYLAADPLLGSIDAPTYSVVRVEGGAAGPLAVSDTTFAAELHPGQTIEVHEGAMMRVLTSPHDTHNLFVEGHDVIWEDWTSTYVVTVYRGDVTHAPSVLYATSDGSDLKGFATDGVDMAWNQSYGPHGDGTFDRTELWTSPYVGDAAAVVPRFAARMEAQRTLSTLGEGWYAYYAVNAAATALDIVLVRLSDGGRKRIALMGDGWEWLNILWIGGGEIAVSARQGRPLRASGVFRFTLSALPDEPPL